MENNSLSSTPTFVIFLDIDGVLNNQISHGTSINLHKVEIPGITRRFYGHIDPECVVELNKLIEKLNAKLVISSTWRLGASLPDLQLLMDFIGVKAEVIGKTEDLRSEYCVRGNEIKKWIHDNCKLVGVEWYWEYHDYVIVDDDSDMLYEHRNNFINTDGKVGLTSTLVHRFLHPRGLTKK